MTKKKSNCLGSWFTIVEMEVNSRCNRKCSYCPVSILPVPNIPRYMSDDIFNRILSELSRINFSGKISYHLYSEPLLRPNLEILVRQVKEKLPDVYQLLFTNGDLLSEERYLSLKEAGIDHFLVTRHDFTPIPERPLQTVKFPTDLILTNRGGTLFELKKSLTLPCYAPSEMLIITVTGDILLCCDDAKRNHVMGNINEQSLEEIWFSKKFIHIRELLQKGKRKDASPICKNCNDTEYFAPGENYEKDLNKQKMFGGYKYEVNR